MTVNIPHAELDKLDAEGRDNYLDAVGRFAGRLVKDSLPLEADYATITSMEGASINLRDEEGDIDIVTVLGESIALGDPNRLAKLARDSQGEPNL